MKQPNEDVPQGTTRDDDLLSLDPRAVTHRNALIAMSRHLLTATLVGNPAPIVSRMYTRLKDPRPGDLVVEMSAELRDAQHRINALGILLEHRVEWQETDEEWEAIKAEDHFLTDVDRGAEDVWYIQYGSDAENVVRWTNCSFDVVPIFIDTFVAPAVTADGRTLTVTRDGLLTSLGDSGFKLR